MGFTLVPPGSMVKVSSQQAGPILSRKDDIHVAYWNVRDVGVKALTIRKLRENNVDIACPADV